jgi:hypothetical protein
MRLATHHFYHRRQARLAASDPFGEKGEREQQQQQQRDPVLSMCHAEHRYATSCQKKISVFLEFNVTIYKITTPTKIVLCMIATA